MQDLTSGNLLFRTLPIKGYAKIDGQDANVVDAAAIQALVQATFYPKPSPPRGHRRAAGAARGGPAPSTPSSSVLLVQPRCLVVGRSVDDGYRLEADLFGDPGQQHILRGEVALHVGHFVQGCARVVECRL